jgi:hypothetical protein
MFGQTMDAFGESVRKCFDAHVHPRRTTIQVPQDGRCPLYCIVLWSLSDESRNTWANVARNENGVAQSKERADWELKQALAVATRIVQPHYALLGMHAEADAVLDGTVHSEGGLEHIARACWISMRTFEGSISPDAAVVDFNLGQRGVVELFHVLKEDGERHEAEHYDFISITAYEVECDGARRVFHATEGGSIADAEATAQAAAACAREHGPIGLERYQSSGTTPVAFVEWGMCLEAVQRINEALAATSTDVPMPNQFPKETTKVSSPNAM